MYIWYYKITWSRDLTWNNRAHSSGFIFIRPDSTVCSTVAPCVSLLLLTFFPVAPYLYQLLRTCPGCFLPVLVASYLSLLLLTCPCCFLPVPVAPYISLLFLTCTSCFLPVPVASYMYQLLLTCTSCSLPVPVVPYLSLLLLKFPDDNNFGLNILFPGIKYTEKDWVRLKVRCYPLQIQLTCFLIEDIYIYQVSGNYVSTN